MKRLCKFELAMLSGKLLCLIVFCESSILPNISLTCDVRIISETALVYPELTGPDMKLIRNPRPSRPMPISMMPVNRASSTAFCQTPPAAWN